MEHTGVSRKSPDNSPREALSETGQVGQFLDNF